MRTTTSRHDNVSPQPGVVHKTACRHCRHRKVKCNKMWPCLNCKQAEQTCEFPSAIRTVNRPKKSQHKSSTQHRGDSRSMQERLDYLETLLSLVDPSAHPGNDDASRTSLSMELEHDDVVPVQGRANTTATSDRMMRDELAPGGALTRSDSASPGYPRSHSYLDSPVGSSTFMVRPPTVSFSDERPWDAIDTDAWHGLSMGTETSLELGAAAYQPVFASSSAQTAFNEAVVDNLAQGSNKNLLPDGHPQPIFDGLSSQSSDGLLLQLTKEFPLLSSDGAEPPPLLPLPYRRFFWKAFIHNVDPVVRLLHKPTTEAAMMVPDVNHYKAQAPITAAIHGVCLIAAISMPASEVRLKFGCDKATLVDPLTRTMEAALTASNFLTTTHLATLQGLVLYLYALKCKEDPRLVALGGTGIRVAEQMQLNVDGADLGFGPLEVELRRRVWWQLLILVNQVHDCSARPAIYSCLSETKFPLNINDDQVDQYAENPSPEQAGFTESSFCLMQYEIVRAFHDITLKRDYLCTTQEPSQSEAEQEIVTLSQTLTSRYMRRFDYDQPLETFVADVMSLILAKRRLLVHTSLKAGNKARTRTKNQQDRLFLIGVQILEHSRSIQTDTRLEDWRWLNDTYFQWSVATLILQELAVRPRSHITNRAWNVMDGVLNDWPDSIRNCYKAVALMELMTCAVSNLKINQGFWNQRLADPGMTVGHNQHGFASDGKHEQKRVQGLSTTLLDGSTGTQILLPSSPAMPFAPDLMMTNMLPLY